jgi:hypothetical protein
MYQWLRKVLILTQTFVAAFVVTSWAAGPTVDDGNCASEDNDQAGVVGKKCSNSGKTCKPDATPDEGKSYSCGTVKWKGADNKIHSACGCNS